MRKSDGGRNTTKREEQRRVKIGCAPPGTYLLDEVLEKDGLLPQRVVHQALGEEDHPVGEVVLREP